MSEKDGLPEIEYVSKIEFDKYGRPRTFTRTDLSLHSLSSKGEREYFGWEILCFQKVLMEASVSRKGVLHELYIAYKPNRELLMNTGLDELLLEIRKSG